MNPLRWLVSYALAAVAVYPATVGTVVNVTGGASDIILDESRGRLYLVRPTPYDAIDIYSIAQRRVLSSIRTDRLPLAGAMSPDKKRLYVTCHDSSALNVIDLDRMVKVSSVSLPAKPEGVAAGNDGRILITTIGAGQNNLLNTLLLYDPSITEEGRSLSTVPVAPPPPLAPQLPPLAGRVFLTNRSQLVATADGSRIIGVNAFNQNNRVVFVFESASGTVKASRFVGDLSTVLSVSRDGSKFMLGLRLFDTDSLTVLAQQNAANAAFPLSTQITAQGFNTVAQQFNIQQNQGGSIFAPDGSYIYSAFNIAPVQNPPARPNITHLLIDDPDNLLIQTALQLTENLAGKMVITSDSSTILGLSESGFMIIELARIMQSPILLPQSTVLLLGNDQCNSNPNGRTGRVYMDVMGSDPGPARLNLQAVLLQTVTSTVVPGLGGRDGPGGGFPGGFINIIFPPVPGAGQPGAFPAGMNQQTAQVMQTAPQTLNIRGEDRAGLEFRFSPTAARSPGTVPPHDYLLQSALAVNVPPRIRVFQNNRNAEAKGDVLPVPVGLSPNEGLVDIVPDQVRQLLYIANSGMNRVEVFDTRRKEFLTPIKVGQLPRSLALAPDGNTLYVACTGGEVVSIIDLVQMKMVGRVKFPPIPFNGNVPVITPSVIAASQRGLQIVMSNGTLWRVVRDEAVPRPISPIIGTSTVTAPRSLVSTPNGEYILLLDGSGNAYLYDSLVDDYVQRRQVVTAPIQGYYGAVGAGPRGQYYLVNGLALNSSLSLLSTAGVTNVPGQTRPGQAPQQVSVPISAVSPANATQFLRFAQPIRGNTNQLLTETPTLELVDVNSGQVMRSSQALEGPLTAVAGNQRTNIPGRQIAVDAAGTTAYALTTSGLSVVPLDPVTAADRPVTTPNAVVNTASYQPGAAPGSLVSIFGRNLGARTEAASSTPLPYMLSGTCVTLNNFPLPLTLVSPGQINAQIPPELAAGRYPFVIRSVERKAASPQLALTVSKYAPAVFSDPESGRALIFHEDGSPVTPQNPARRDRPLVMYATGLGVPRGAKIASGTPAPEDPPAASDKVEVRFGDPRYAQSEVIVDWNGFAPGFVGLYQLNVRIPGFNMGAKPDHPVMIMVGGACSPTDPAQTPAECPKVTAAPPIVPTVAIN